VKRKQLAGVLATAALWAAVLVNLSRHVAPMANMAAGLAILLFGAWRRPDNRLALYMIGMFFPAYVLIDASLLNTMGKTVSHRRLLDDLFSRMEGGVSAQVFHWSQHHPAVAVPFAMAYGAIGIFIAISLAFGDWRRILRAYAWMLLIAPVFYFIFPAVGPGYLTDASAPINCLPSVHLTTAILGTIYLPRPWKWVGVVFIALTACATITTGQHYLIDLIASVPFAAMIVKLVNWKPATSRGRAPQAA
jgi:hypothetical protein